MEKKIQMNWALQQQQERRERQEASERNKLATRVVDKALKLQHPSLGAVGGSQGDQQPGLPPDPDQDTAQKSYIICCKWADHTWILGQVSFISVSNFY